MPLPSCHYEGIGESQENAPSSAIFETVEDFKKALSGPPKRIADRLQEAGPDPDTVASTLTIAVRHATDMDPEAYLAPASKTFDLGRLKDVEDYLEDTENDTIIYLKPLDTTVADCQTTLTQLREKGRLSEAEQRIRIDKTEKLNTSMLNMVKHFVYELQTFNADKKWEVPERALFKMRERLLKSLEANGPAPEEELILLDMFNDPEHLATFGNTRHAQLERNAKEDKHSKRSIPAARLLSHIHNSFDDLGAAAGTWNGVLGRMTGSPMLSWEAFIQHYPGLSPKLRLSPKLPKRIRQHFLESAFLRSELQSLQFETVYMVYFLRELLKIWWRAGPDAWEFGKKHVYVMAHFREYEYARHALLSTQYLILRLDYKIAKFSRSGEGRKYSIPDAYEGLKEDTSDAAWEDWFVSVSEELLSVEELIEREEKEERVKEKHFEEQLVLAEKLKKQMMEALREEKGKAKKEKRVNGKGQAKVKA